MVEDLEFYKKIILELEVKYLSKSEERVIQDNFNADNLQVIRPKEIFEKSSLKIEPKVGQRNIEA